MKTAVALLCLAVFPARAQDVAEWGGTGCQLVPVSGEAYIAEARCHNAVTSGQSLTEGVMQIGDMVVHLAVRHGPGDVPDLFTVTPPVGYVAYPGVLSLDEKARGMVLIYPWVGM